ncbi:MAG TPA: hypothetical protein DC048_05285 [Planctomycetaceae bacterium]|nr:hypothetical protein [Planctomycetaceae bacterium]
MAPPPIRTIVATAPITLSTALFAYVPSLVSMSAAAPDRVIVSAAIDRSVSAPRFISAASSVLTPTTDSVLAPVTVTVRVPCFSTCTGCSSVHDEA